MNYRGKNDESEQQQINIKANHGAGKFLYTLSRKHFYVQILKNKKVQTLECEAHETKAYSNIHTVCNTFTYSFFVVVGKKQDYEV